MIKLLKLLKKGKIYSLYVRDPAPTVIELLGQSVNNYYIIHNEHGTIEMGQDHYYTVLSNFNMLEQVTPALNAGQTIQDIGKNEMMQRLIDSGAVLVPKDGKKDPNPSLN